MKSIDCESDPGHGTTFKIYVPAISRREAVSESTTKETGPKGGTETILVVDDKESVRDMIGQILSRAGYKLMTAVKARKPWVCTNRKAQRYHWSFWI